MFSYSMAVMNQHLTPFVSVSVAHDVTYPENTLFLKADYPSSSNHRKRQSHSPMTVTERTFGYLLAISPKTGEFWCGFLYLNRHPVLVRILNHSPVYLIDEVLINVLGGFSKNGHFCDHAKSSQTDGTFSCNNHLQVQWHRTMSQNKFCGYRILRLGVMVLKVSNTWAFRHGQLLREFF